LLDLRAVYGEISAVKIDRLRNFFGGKLPFFTNTHCQISSPVNKPIVMVICRRY
jgi:hypothetical protein